jgi:hypothetical protein
VVVTEKSGKAISGLQEQDFSLLDQKVPRPFSFHSSRQGATSNPAVEAIVVVDAVNGSALNVSYETQELQRFLRQNQGLLPIPAAIALVTDMSTRILQPASRDGNALADSLRANHPGVRALPAQAHARSDRVQTSIYALERSWNPKRRKKAGSCSSGLVQDGRSYPQSTSI